MPSRWGSRKFSRGDARDKEVEDTLMAKLETLDEGTDDPKDLPKPDTIHAMHPSFQPYSADAFGKKVRELRAKLGKKTFIITFTFFIIILLSHLESFFSCYSADGNGMVRGKYILDDEASVIPPRPNMPHTSRASGSAQRNVGYDDEAASDYEGEEAEDAATKSLIKYHYGTNEGLVMLPHIWTVSTHPPSNGETGRHKKMHMIVQTLSAQDEDGLTVHCTPRSNQIVLTFHESKVVKETFWGSSGRQVVVDKIASNDFERYIAEDTNNFNNVPNQKMTVEFPFKIVQVKHVQPFLIPLDENNVNVDEVPQLYTGIYITASVDWVDEQAVRSGKRYTRILKSPEAGGFYSNQEATPAVSNRTNGYPNPRHHNNYPQTAAGNNLTSNEYMMQMLMEQMRLSNHVMADPTSFHQPTRTAFTTPHVVPRPASAHHGRVAGFNDVSNASAAPCGPGFDAKTSGAFAPRGVSLRPRPTPPAEIHISDDVEPAAVVRHDSGATGGAKGGGVTSTMNALWKAFSPGSGTAATAASTNIPDANDNVDDEEGVSYDDEAENGYKFE